VERRDSNDFADLAQTYCVWAESAPGTPNAELHAALALLPRLYYAALSLPREWPDTELAGLPEPPPVARERVYKRFSAVPVGYYADPVKVLSPGTSHLGTGDVHDDLTDIYSELKEGLWLLEGGHPDLAAGHWGASFWAHWGQHCTGALRALHCYATDPGAD
jgi:hypothetical protein